MDQDPPLPLPDHTIILLNPSYMRGTHPAAKPELEPGSDFEPAAESDSGWNSDLDSDSDASQPASEVQPITQRAGRLRSGNCLIHWRPSVLENYIKFRIYFREWCKGYTHLVPEKHLQHKDPVSKRAESTAKPTNFNRLLIRKISKLLYSSVI